jgi:hypothetical protein
MGEYTAPAIAGSLEVWKAVVAAPAWMGDPEQAGPALYSQIRRWYELIILGQDPPPRPTKRRGPDEASPSARRA